MTKEKAFFINVLSDHINKNATVVPDNLDWEIIKKYAKQQQVEGIIYSQTKNSAFLQAFASTLYYATNRDQVLIKLLPQISNPHFIIKGTEVAALYPVPGLRTMGDIDLVVKDRDEVHSLLISQGFDNISKFSDREWQYFKGKTEFEIHDRLVYSETINVNKQEKFFNDFWKYVKDGKLDWNFHFLFLIFHLRKHFMNSGVGFRQFMDLAVVISNVDLDWSWLEDNLKAIELWDFFCVVLAFLKQWFGVDSPIETKAIDPIFYEKATDKIFMDGVFGFDNEENKNAQAININRNGGTMAQVRSAMKVIFPSYKQLRVVPHYSFIDGRPYLLPFVWIYRFFRGRKKVDVGIHAAKSKFVSNDKIIEREDLYKQWGL